MDDLKLLGTSEDLENEIKIMKTIHKNINVTFRLEKCAKIYLKKGRVLRKTYLGNTWTLKNHTQQQRVSMQGQKSDMTQSL